MPSDASIYSLVQPQRSPVEQQTQVLQMRHLMDAGRLNALTLQEKEREIDEGKRLRDLFGRGNVKPEEVGAINPQQGMAYRKSLRDEELQSAELATKKMEHLVKGMGLLKERLPTVRDEPSFQAYREYAMRLLGPDAVEKAQMPPSFDPEWVKRQIVKGEEMFTPKPQQVGGQVVDMNPFTNPKAIGMQIAMSASERDSSERGWAGLNQPKFSEDRGVFIAPPRVGPSTPPFAGAPSPAMRMTGQGGIPNLAQQAGASQRPAPGPGTWAQQPGTISPTTGRPLSREPIGSGTPQSSVTPGDVVTPSGLPPRQEKPPAGYRYAADGQTLEPIDGGPAAKLGEAQVKQRVGVDNTRAAIKDYRDALKNFGGLDTLNPNARARMGTVYNNMLLQAKEAYNLGVLNGPDYTILQEVITSPLSGKGFITSKEALDDQAKKLDEIMERVGQTVSSSTRQRQERPAGRSGSDFSRLWRG